MNYKLTEFIIAVINNNLAAFFAENKVFETASKNA